MMKKKNFKLVVLTLAISALFIFKTNAQPIDIGGGLVIGTSSPNVGLKIQGNYGMDFLLKNLSGSAAFSLFFPATPGNITYNRFSFDLDGHYKFYEMTNFEFYAVGGLNIAYAKSKWKATGNTITSGVKPGLNVGAGAFYGFSDKMKAFSEFKYIISGFGQTEITFGVLFEL